jgi:hypothetical protein
MNKRTGQTQEEMPEDFNMPAEELAISLRYTHKHTEHQTPAAT